VRRVGVVSVALLGCGRVAIDPAGDAAIPDAGIDAELVELAPGWSASVYVELTASYEFRADAFLDSGGCTYDNAPEHVFLLSSPYPEGLGVVAGHAIVQVFASDASLILRDFTATGGYPDVASSVAQAGTALHVASSSCGSGDGVYELDGNWTVGPRRSTTNNTAQIGFDAAGAFDNLGVPTTYYGAQAGMYRLDGTQVYNGGDQRPHGPIVVTPVGDLVLVEDVNAFEHVVRVASVSHAVTASPWVTNLTLVAGELPAEPALAYAIADLRRLVEVTPADHVVIAETASPDWTWRSAVAPRAGHPLRTSQDVVFYVLESNRTLNRDRILRIAR
jgi:hypothetical protein